MSRGFWRIQFDGKVWLSILTLASKKFQSSSSDIPRPSGKKNLSSKNGCCCEKMAFFDLLHFCFPCLVSNFYRCVFRAGSSTWFPEAGPDLFSSYSKDVGPLWLTDVSNGWLQHQLFHHLSNGKKGPLVVQRIQGDYTTRTLEMKFFYNTFQTVARYKAWTTAAKLKSPKLIILPNYRAGIVLTMFLYASFCLDFV